MNGEDTESFHKVLDGNGLYRMWTNDNGASRFHAFQFGGVAMDIAKRHNITQVWFYSIRKPECVLIGKREIQ